MIDLKILREEHGLTQENLKAWLSGNPLLWTATQSDGSSDTQIEMRKQLWNRVRSRIQEGMNRNFTDYRIYHALDKAWEVPFRQLSPTMLSDFLGQDPNTKEVYDQLQKWGLTHLVTQELDKRTGEATGKKVFDMPMFFEVYVPLVKAYVTIRWGSVMNDLDQDPFFDYVWAKLTTPNRLKCSAITDRVQVMSNQYGYYDVVKQAVLKMLHYSWCFQYPMESWHSEQQMKYADELDVANKIENENGEPCSKGDIIRITTREGLRYHHPHPTRFYRDLNHGAWTYNYDCGAEFGGYWQIRRYRDVVNSPFWNKEQISIGPNSLVEDHRTFFASVYSACTLNVPVVPTQTKDGNALLATVGGGIGEMDRERAVSYLYYGTDHLDQGVLITEHFEKLIPNQNGLGSYDCPVWFRFVVAGDNTTFLYAEPLPYVPITYYGYDADESRTMNSSMSLEVLPFQDQFGNVLSQILLTAKQNLANVTFIDTDQVDKKTIDVIKNLGERFFRSLNIMGFSGKQAVRSQNRIQDAVQAHTFPKGNTAELMNVLKTILDILERVLVMSSQEMAQAASHEQTREEIRVVDASKSTRKQFTAKPVAIARESMKRQIYCGLMAFADPFFYSHIPSDLPLTKEVLESMGFTYADPEEHRAPNDRHHRVKVELKKTAIDLWQLASTRDGQDRPNDAAMAQVMAQMALQLLSNPLTAQAIGASQAIMIANQIAQLSGLPRDFKLQDMSSDNQAAAQQQLQQVSQAVLQQVGQEITPLLEITKKNAADIAALARMIGANLPANPANDSTPTNPPTPSAAPPPGSGVAAPAGVA